MITVASPSIGTRENNMLTPQEYVAYDGIRCPFCESNTAETIGSLESNHGMVFQDCECRDCGKQWTDEYSLTGYSTE